MNFLVTAGATREYIDPVRFISNPSSGKMGIEITKAARRRGHNVILIIGHCTEKSPLEVPIVMTGTALEMRKTVLQYTDWADVLVMTAAVGDWRVKRISGRKLKKEGKTINLKLTVNPDILIEVGRLKKRGKKIFLVGFSVDTESVIDKAKEKLKKKNLDLIVVNLPDTFGSQAIEAVIIDKNGNAMRQPLQSKRRLAGRLVRIIEKSSPV